MSLITHHRNRAVNSPRQKLHNNLHHKRPHRTTLPTLRTSLTRTFTTETDVPCSTMKPFHLTRMVKTPLSQRKLPPTRVVVTGIGVVSPLGSGIDNVYDKILCGESSISPISSPELTSLKLQTKSYAPVGNIIADLSEDIIPKSLRQVLSRHQVYAISAAHQALDQAGLLGKYINAETRVKTVCRSGAEEMCELCEDQPSCAYQRDESDRFGVCIGSSIGCVEEVGAAHVKMESKGGKGVGAYSLPKLLVNLAAGHITQLHQARALTHTVSTACATGAHAIGDALNFIRQGRADVIIAGGTETGVSPLSLSLFNRIHALSRQNAENSGGPFTKERDGFVMGEGSAMLILESLDHALARNANILCEVIGYGLSSDAYHITQPHILGRGAYMAMENAMTDAGVDMSYVDYVNAHATSTPIGDVAESVAIRALTQIHGKEQDNPGMGLNGEGGNRLFSRPIVSSTKGNVGHLLGAAGAFEAAISIQAIRTNKTPPTTLRGGSIDPAIPINIAVYDPETKETGCLFDKLVEAEGGGVNVTQHEENQSIDVVLSNSFGFGGTNASLLFARYNPTVM